MKKLIAISFLCAMALSVSVASAHYDKICKKEIVKHEIVAPKKVSDYSDLSIVAILPDYIGIGEIPSYTDYYLVKEVINKSLQTKVAYIWFHQDRRC